MATQETATMPAGSSNQQFFGNVYDISSPRTEDRATKRRANDEGSGDRSTPSAKRIAYASSTDKEEAPRALVTPLDISDRMSQINSDISTLRQCVDHDEQNTERQFSALRRQIERNHAWRERLSEQKERATAPHQQHLPATGSRPKLEAHLAQLQTTIGTLEKRINRCQKKKQDMLWELAQRTEHGQQSLREMTQEQDAPASNPIQRLAQVQQLIDTLRQDFSDSEKNDQEMIRELKQQTEKQRNKVMHLLGLPGLEFLRP